MKNTNNDQLTITKLMRRPGYMFRRCSQVSGGLFEKGCRELGLTTGQYDVLFVLANERFVDQDRLAIILGLDRSSTGVIATNLERKGLISRETKSDDRRKRRLTLTKSGTKIFAKAEPIAEAARSQVLAALSASDQRQLFKLLQRIVDSSTSKD